MDISAVMPTSPITNQSIFPLIVIFAVAFLTTYITTPIAKLIARKVGAVDYPNKRRINKKPIPRMGGIAVALGLGFAFLVQLFGTIYLGWPPVLLPSPHFESIDYHLLSLGFVAIFITGAIDDIWTLKPLQKLIGQIIAACIAVSGGLVIGVIVNPFTADPISLGPLAYPLTVIYLVCYVNIINLIDGLDGLSSGITCIASATMFVISLMAGRIDAASLALALAATTLAFLRYNFHPAQIFLGDSGSLLIGYALGVISLLSVTRIAGLTTIIVPLVIAGIPIIDTFSAIVRRKRAHISVGTADRGHIHHRLIDEGFDQRQAVLLIYLWTAVLCIGSFVMTQVHLYVRIVIFIVLFALSAYIVHRLHLFRPVLLHYTNPDTGDDELVSEDDPDFDAAEREFEEEHPHHFTHSN